VADDLKYTAEHEWISVVGTGDDAVLRVGITSYAQQALGDIVFVTLPAVGTTVTAGQSLGEVESTKSVSDVYAPVAGTVTARNEELDGAPELVNSDAEHYGGSGVGNLGRVGAGPVEWHGQPASATLRIPPLATVWLRHEPAE